MTAWACELIGECGSLFVTTGYVLQVDRLDLFRKKPNLHSSKKDDFEGLFRGTGIAEGKRHTPDWCMRE